MYSLTGTPGASWLKTGDYGDMTEYLFINRATPRYRVEPESATGTNFYRDAIGAAQTQDATIPMARKRFDMRRSARWHALRIDQVGSATINGLDIQIGGDSGE